MGRSYRGRVLPTTGRRSPLLARLRPLLRDWHPTFLMLLREQSVEGDLGTRLRIEKRNGQVVLALGRPGLADELIQLGADPFVARAATAYAAASSLADLEHQILRAEGQRPGVLGAWTCVAALAEAYASRKGPFTWTSSRPQTSHTSRSETLPTVLGLFGPRPTP